MTTRATPLSLQHVEALNTIDIEFYKDQKVIDAWKLLLDNYLDYPKDPKAPNFQSKLDASVAKSGDLLTDLLYEMGKSLDYSFDKVHLKREVYIPKGHTDIIIDQEIIRRSLVSILLGQAPIPIKIVDTEIIGEKQEEKKEG
jgi:hypothetical protein